MYLRHKTFNYYKANIQKRRELDFTVFFCRQNPPRLQANYAVLASEWNNYHKCDKISSREVLCLKIF